MEIEGYSFPDNLYYDRHHYWARIEGEQVVQGLTDYAQKMAGDIVYVELPRQGRKLEQGKAFSSVESGKWVGRIYAVVSGQVVEVNEELEESATNVNEDPYGRGWIVKIKPDDSNELTNLMQTSDPAFPQFVREEIEAHRSK